MMEDVSDEVADLTVNIDSESHKIPEEMYQLGLATKNMHDDTKLRVQHVEMDADDWPPHFVIEGRIDLGY